LPCLCASVCRAHLSDKTSKNGIIDCLACQNRFQIKTFNFEQDLAAKALVDSDAFLTSDEKESKQSLLELTYQRQVLYDKFTSELNGFEVYNFDYFQEKNRIIEIQREELKRKIDKMSNEMVELNKKAQASFQRQRDKLKTNEPLFDVKSQEKSLIDHFRKIDLTSETTIQLKEEQQRQINVIEDKLERINRLKGQVNSCGFTPNPEFSKSNFGSLWFYSTSIFGCSFLNKDQYKSITMWDIESGECLKELSGHHGAINCVIQLPNSQCASGSADKNIKIWDLNSSSCLRTIDVKMGVFSLQLLTENTIACGLYGGDIKIWNFNDGSCVSTLSGHQERVSCLVLLQCQMLASGSWDNSIKLWDLSTGSCILTIEGHTDKVSCLHKLENGHLVSCSSDHTIKIWIIPTGECLRTLIGHTDSVSRLESNENGDLISCSKQSTIKLWKVDTGDCVKTLSHTKCFNDNSGFAILKYYQNGILACMSLDGIFTTWDLNEGICTKTIDTNTIDDDEYQDEYEYEDGYGDSDDDFFTDGDRLL
jgi:WD40 repeat protein